MRTYIYADESGNFDFSRNAGATRYFLLTTVVINDHSIEPELLELRRELAWEGVALSGGFHATTDKQRVRNRVFDILRRHDFRIDTTILDKRKAEPQIRSTDLQFYKQAWFHHMQYVAPRVVSSQDELLVVAASIGNKREQNAYLSAIQDVLNQTSPTNATRAEMWGADSDPCLQVADYCSWAIQRKWERSDLRSYQLVQDKIESEFDLFQPESTVYY